MALDLLVLNGVSLNDETNYGLEAADFTPPVKRPEWAPGADSDGANLIRTPLYENRVVTLTLRVGKQASMNAALEKLGALVDLFQEAEKNPDGIPLVWEPANATKKITFYVLTGAVTEIPVVNEGTGAGFYVSMPQVKVVLTCKPFGYGPEEEVAAAKSIEAGLSVVVLTVPSVPGDVPAEGRLVVKDTAKVGRRFVEWGLENRYYNAATSLVEGAEALTPVGGIKSEAANTGAYKPGAGTKLTVATTLLPEPTICFETGVLKHVGRFRVLLRAQAVLGAESLAENVKVRLSYQDGEGPFRANEWQTPVVAGKYVRVDLGTIGLTEKVAGTQKWVGRVEAYSKNTAAKDVLHGNYLTFVPVLEGYGKARGQTAPTLAGTVSAYDNFDAGSGALNGKTPPFGAAWATSGAAGDWEYISAGGGGALKRISRKTKSDVEPRYGQIGAASGNSAISATLISNEKPTAGEILLALILRWTNASNYAYAVCQRNAGTGGEQNFVWQIGTVVAGTPSVLGQQGEQGPRSGEVQRNATLSATLDGALTLDVTNGPRLSGASAAIATGGALASGKAGIYDRNTGTSEVVRSIDNVSVLTLPGVPYVVQSERTLEVRSDSTLTQDSTGTYTGSPPEYRGSRFYLPQKGSAGRTSRIIVCADRNDLDASDQQTIGDTFTAAVFATPRYSAIPR